ncbi:MAG: HAMP domain-containing protein [Deltaproteobacteria bacterium]|nr:HAMP domain-containing protein [Deltaproteobacteria bacterium]
MIHRLDIKIVFVLMVTVLIPLGFSVYLVANAVDTSLRLGLNAELAAQLEHALESQRAHIEEIKRGVRLRFSHLVDSRQLASVAETGDEDAIRNAIEKLVQKDQSLQEIRLLRPDGPSVEYSIPSPAGKDRVRTLPLSKDISLGSYSKIEALFAVDAGILAAYKQAGDDFSTYRALVKAPPDYLGNRFVWVYLTILGLAVVLSIAIGILWARRLAGRIHRLSTATSLVAEGDLSVRVDAGSGDEVGRLVESFNGMVAELAVNRARIEYLQKISAWQEMARRLAHEIKNPLTPIQLAAQQLREKYGGEDESFKRLLEQSTEIISEEVTTLRRLTSDFSSFARLPEIKPEEVDLTEFLDECEGSLGPVAEQEGIAITFSTPTEEMQINIDRIMMKRVVDNLVRNSAEALKDADVESPRIAVTAARETNKKQSELRIRIEDNGPGVLPEHHPSIFDPYFTTKTEGTGLGLAISKKIVLEHGGRIWLDELPSGGAVFSIVLPFKLTGSRS